MKTDELTYHIPALLEETVNLLVVKPEGVYIDATFGGGGHSRAIISRLNNDGSLFSFDRDADAKRNSIDDRRFTFVLSNFRYLRNFMRFHNVGKVDGIMADLGVSFHHFDEAQRGFSFRYEAPLDMRMNQAAERKAADIVADYSADELKRLFKVYADLKNPGKVADAISGQRAVSPILTTTQLAEVVRPALDPRCEKKELAQVFQALRIETNNEMSDLATLLATSVSLLKPGGRLAILTYHSVEDRMVKNFFKTGNIEGKDNKDFYGRVISPWKVITKKPIEPSDEEIERNPRARSAKLRVAELVQIHEM